MKTLKTIQLICLIGVCFCSIYVLMAGCISFAKEAKDKKDKDTRKECKDIRLAYRITHHINEFK